MIFQEESGEKKTEPPYLCDMELDDETIGTALSSPVSIQEKEYQRTEDKHITLMKEVCCQPSPFSRTQERADPYTNFVGISHTTRRFICPPPVFLSVFI